MFKKSTYVMGISFGLIVGFGYASDSAEARGYVAIGGNQGANYDPQNPNDPNSQSGDQKEAAGHLESGLSDLQRNRAISSPQGVESHGLGQSSVQQQGRIINRTESVTPAQGAEGRGSMRDLGGSDFGRTTPGID